MEKSNTPTVITVETIVDAPVEKVWEYWTGPEHIMQWNSASEDWHTTASTSDLRVGGKFSATMAARDGSFSFDFWGIYDIVELYSVIASTLGDNRKVSIHFTPVGGGTKLVETFEAETTNSVEMQKGGWQAILDNFKKYVEKK